MLALFTFILTLPPQFVYMERQNKTTQNHYKTNWDAVLKDHSASFLRSLSLWSNELLDDIRRYPLISTVNLFKPAWPFSKAATQV